MSGRRWQLELTGSTGAPPPSCRRRLGGHSQRGQGADRAPSKVLVAYRLLKLKSAYRLFKLKVHVIQVEKWKCKNPLLCDGRECSPWVLRHRWWRWSGHQQCVRQEPSKLKSSLSSSTLFYLIISISIIIIGLTNMSHQYHLCHNYDHLITDHVPVQQCRAQPPSCRTQQGQRSCELIWILNINVITLEIVATKQKYVIGKWKVDMLKMNWIDRITQQPQGQEQ